jgi:hypothetical protein
MRDFDKLKSECESYINKNYYNEFDYIEDLEFDGYDPSIFTWGMTNYNSFERVAHFVNTPKRIVIHGCGIGYQCFYWNHIFPNIPCVGIDLLSPRISFGKEMIEKYSIQNVELHEMDICDFKVQDGDLIWQNNLLFDDDFIYQFNIEILNHCDVEFISYKYFDDYTDLQYTHHYKYINKNSEIDVLHIRKFSIQTSWSEDQNLYYYYKDLEFNSFDVNYVLPEFRNSIENLQSYNKILYAKKDIKSDLLKRLYNKKNIKQIFSDLGFNVPKLYFYSNIETDITVILEKMDTFVIKPAHACESVDVYIKSQKNQKLNLDKINKKINQRLNISDKNHMDLIFKKEGVDYNCDWKDTERGILIEEYINVVYELKVFVVFGTPIIGDLRTGSNEILDRIDFIKKRNPFLNWDREFEIIKDFAKYLKTDIFRIDFLYDGNKLYASECAFMPGTILPLDIENMILHKVRSEYFKFYYPKLSDN